MNQEKIEAKLRDAGVPPERAEQKAQDSAIGWVLTLIGAVAFAVAGAVALILVQSHADVGMWLVMVIALFVAFSFVLVGLGLHLVAREAAPKAIRAISDALVAVIQAIRGNGSVPSA